MDLFQRHKEKHAGNPCPHSRFRNCQIRGFQKNPYDRHNQTVGHENQNGIQQVPGEAHRNSTYYQKAHQPLLVDERFRFSEHMTFAGLARPFHALDEMGYIIGGFDGLLPYSKEIDRCATEGGMFKAITYCNPKYTASLNKVLEILEQMELAEQSEEDAGYECEEDADE